MAPRANSPRSPPFSADPMSPENSLANLAKSSPALTLASNLSIST